MKNYLFLLLSTVIWQMSSSQNIGIGTSTPQAKLHIKGNADTSQLLIDANTTQSNTQPLIRLRDASGADVLHIHSDAQYNLFAGVGAGRANIPSSTLLGLYNTFLGSGAGYQNTTGYANTVTGRNALFYNTTGAYNTASGFKSLFSNVGNNNSAFGTEALIANSGGNQNTAIGSGALYFNVAASNRTAIGARAMYYANSTASSIILGDVAVGYEALRGSSNPANNTGDANTAIGYQALINNSSGYENVAIGYRALTANTSGVDNTAIGTFADMGAGNLTNSTAIGYTSLATASNEIRLGNDFIRYLFCRGPYYSTTAFAANMFVASDGQIMRSTSSQRYKKDIKTLEVNTSKIYELQPVSYKSIHDNTSHFGLIAEEVANIFPLLVEYAKEKDVVEGSSSEKMIPDAVQYPLLSVLLLKEVQKHEVTLREQQQIIEGLKKEKENQQKQIEAVMKDRDYQQQKTDELEKKLTVLLKKLNF